MDKLAEAYDMKYLCLKDMNDADSVLDDLLSTDERVLMECYIDPMDLTK